ncbi:amidohydrolase [Paracoccus litorisediminis]|uniref:Amidohydrolase n=1 Tax=Paracoccus litorisediminis TaxID=2006130 RepID=A0A844HHW2_9RHOB|nr:amidohydrolase [Paracoccus litorisediminis]MTH59500.1 amidohydrolase [Paracoccus litorisediminis]
MTIAAKVTAPLGAEGPRTPAWIAGRIEDFVALRHEFHAAPELAFHEVQTSARIAELLTRWGYQVRRLARTGIVATLENGDGPALAIRADIDALPITETTGLPFASTNAGVMHACGHDGHMAILLAAAHHLSLTRRFRGTLRLIFQPAEEIGAGAKALIEAGLFRDQPVDAIFGLHNWPGVAAGHFGFVEGPAMAAVDKVEAVIRGRGGHGAEPHLAIDPVVAAAHAVTALQTVVARNTDPRETAVVTVASIHGGAASNVIPDRVELALTLRSFSDAVRDRLRDRVPAIIDGVSASLGAAADVVLTPGFPSVVNSVEETRLIRRVAVERFGAAAVLEGFAPRTASEDFAFYLHHRPGSFVFVGNGDGPALHSPEYRFNDDIIGPAAALWVALAERFLTGGADA